MSEKRAKPNQVQSPLQGSHFGGRSLSDLVQKGLLENADLLGAVSGVGYN
jgi:hypothetical protein